MADITVAPGVEYDTSIYWGVTGLAGTIGIRLLDGNGGTAVARATTGIREFPAGTGRYEYTRTAPGTAGGYQEFWDDGATTPSHVGNGDSVQVTSDATAAIGGTTNLYISADELKAALSLSGTTFADDDVNLAIPAACRAIDAFRRTFYFPATQTRYYSPDRYACEITINDLVSASEVVVDRDGDGTYSEEWTQGIDFYLDPPNASTDGHPYKRLALRQPQTSRRFPGYQRAVRITGVFGWAETPAQVKESAKILATQLVNRRDVPFGIITAGSEMVAMARLGRLDPHVAWLLEQIPGEQRPALRSLQLG